MSELQVYVLLGVLTAINTAIYGYAGYRLWLIATAWKRNQRS